MSYLSTPENVGFSGIPQNISEASCATQYKMAVEGVPGGCNDVNMFSHDSSGDEQTYISHLNDNYFHSKFKIDPNELYTFHDSDVIAGEITVSHTDDNFIFTDNEDKARLESPGKEIDLIGSLTNGDSRNEIKTEVSNGYYIEENAIKFEDHILPTAPVIKETKTSNTKAPKTKTHSQKKELKSNPVLEVQQHNFHSPKGQLNTSASNKTSIISDNSISSTSSKVVSTSKASATETFLDVFKRETGVVETAVPVVKTESSENVPLPPPSTPAPTGGKNPTSSAKKISTGKTSQPRARRGRGPAVHESLQRIQSTCRAVAEPNRPWHAPGVDYSTCGPLDGTRPIPFTVESSSSDDDNMPDFECGTGPVCVEESAAESRAARLALRRAALRRHVARAHTALTLATDHTRHALLAATLKKQLSRSRGAVPTRVVSRLLADRGMPALLTPRERRDLREEGWSGGEGGAGAGAGGGGGACAAERCVTRPLPLATHCLAHIACDRSQRLFAACAAVFAGGARCMQALLPLQDHTPLCDEHAWKRDNYDKLNRDSKPRKPAGARKRAWGGPPRPPRPPRRAHRPPRHKHARPPHPPHPPHLHAHRTKSAPHPPQPQSQPRAVPEAVVCSNSSAYDSSEDAALSDEYGGPPPAAHAHAQIDVESSQVPADDILDPAVLSQIPDEAFTEFFNQAEGSGAFAESSELAAALEAVLDERALDHLDVPYTHTHAHAHHKGQIGAVSAVSMPSGAPS